MKRRSKSFWGDEWNIIISSEERRQSVYLKERRLWFLAGCEQTGTSASTQFDLAIVNLVGWLWGRPAPTYVFH